MSSLLRLVTRENGVWKQSLLGKERIGNYFCLCGLGQCLRCDEVDVPHHCCGECCWGGVQLPCQQVDNYHTFLAARPQKYRQLDLTIFCSTLFPSGLCPSKHAFRLTLQKTKCRKFETNIPRKGISGPQSQFPHSCVCERITYSHNRSAFSAGGYMWTEPGNI